MKLAVAVLVFAGVIGSHATSWQDIRSPLDSPRYAEIMSKLFPTDNVDSTRTGRITNGQPAQLGQFPYQAFMYLYDSDGFSYLCGGSIINKRWILTAAHCVENIIRVEVFLGAINRYLDGRQGSFIKHNVVTNRNSIIMHQGYNPVKLSNDIGLVELPADAPLSHDFVGLILLPQGVDATRSLVGVTATVSGFGRTSDTVSQSSATLNFVRLPIGDNSICSRTFGADFVNQNHVCLPSVYSQSSCSGDSGGPLTIIGQNGQLAQVGIVSYGAAAGCTLGFPAVFTRVTSFIPWIELKTGLKFS